jgi:hypothetical protein
LPEVIPSSRPTDQASSPTEEKPTIRDWIVGSIVAFFESA